MKRISTIAAALAAGTMATAGAAYARPHHAHHDNGKHLGWYNNHRHVKTRTVTVYRSGQYLPRNYYVNRTYYVQPTTYGLQAPPPGYEWVRVGNSVYLTQTNSGLISQVIANLFD